MERRTTVPQLSGRPRRLLRAAHVAVSGGWLGLVIAMLVLGLSALTTQSTALAEAAYVLLGRVGRAAIPPLAVTTLVTGVALSLLTPWGLVRHWWVLVKLVLAVGVILTAVTLTDVWIAAGQAHPAPGLAGRLVAGSLVHLAMLLLATVISVDKPWGRTPWALGPSRRRGRRLVGARTIRECATDGAGSFNLR